MRQGLYRAGLEFSYPKNGSALEIVRRLHVWAAYRPTTDPFPWHLARPLSHALSKAHPSFAYAELTLFCKGEAARRILNPTTNGYRRWILTAVLNHHPQIAGIFYEHLGYWVKEHLARRGLDEWPDCEGLSPSGFGNRLLEPEDVEANRLSLLLAIREAGYWYERALALIGLGTKLEGRASAHDMPYWIGGANMPKPVRVPVTVEEDGIGHLLIGPDKEEAKPMIDAKWQLPEYAVDADDLEFEPPPAVAPKRAPVENKPTVAKPETPPAAAPADDVRQTAAKALELATHLDDNPKVKAPNHLTVFRLYCVDALPLREIARRCKCSHATIINRKLALETRLRLPLDTFRGRDEEVRPLTGAAQYAKARRIHPGRLIE